MDFISKVESLLEASFLQSVLPAVQLGVTLLPHLWSAYQLLLLPPVFTGPGVLLEGKERGRR